MRLFRYRAFEHGYKEIETLNLHFSHPDMFNDPFDCRPILIPATTNEEVWKAMASIDDFPNSSGAFERARIAFPIGEKSIEAANEMAKRTLNDTLSKMAVCCFSESYEISLMWAHYARNHTGICIGYDSFGKDILATVKPVTYISERPGFSLIRAFGDDGVLMVLNKDIVWSYEKEWRTIIGPIEDKKAGIDFHITADCIKSVHCGSKISEGDLDALVSLRRKMGLRFEIYVADANVDSFQLTFKKYGH